MIRTKGEPGTGNVVEAVRHVRKIAFEIEELVKNKKNPDFIKAKSLEYRVPAELVQKTLGLGKLEVVNFAAGGIATPADAALMMQLGVDGVFVGSGIFKSQKPEKYAKAIVEATRNYSDPAILAKISRNLGEPMKGFEIKTLDLRMQDRGI